MKPAHIARHRECKALCDRLLGDVDAKKKEGLPLDKDINEAADHGTFTTYEVASK